MIFLGSLPGLYFLFSSKKALFRAAVEWMLQCDIEAVARVSPETDRPFHDRLFATFGQWAGRYTGPLARDVMFVVEDNPELLGAMVEVVLHRFGGLVIEAIAGTSNAEAGRRMSQTLISASIGMKRQVGERRATAIGWR